MYKEYYDEYCNEVHRVIGSYIFWRLIQNSASSDKSVLKGLNNTPLSWVLIRHSLQVTLFVTLGRVFDIDGEAFSVDDLLKCCVEEIELFGADALRDRKIQHSNGTVPDWLEEYMTDVIVPTEKEFHILRGEIAKRRKIFEKTYRPIRHKLIAHADKEYLGKADELWAETNIQELEEIIWFLHDLKESLFESYENGKELSLQGRRPDIEFYEKDYALLLASISAA